MSPVPPQHLDVMSNYQPGDSLTLSREGKVFITQYQSVAGFASLTRVLGDDPEGDIASMQALLDVAYRDSVRRNLLAVSECYEAAGSGNDVDVELLLSFLEVRDESEEEAPKRKRKRKTRS